MNRVPLRHLFIILLLPWLVMGLAAYALVSVGVNDLLALALALAAALVATLIIGRYQGKLASPARAEERKKRK
jgi:positive regulator of sigma E activity